MADSNLVICPECNARHHEDLIRCPGCHAFLIDANPWRSQQSLLAAMGALVITIVVVALTNFAPGGFAEVVNNPISQLIVLFGTFGLLLLVSRLRTVGLQEKAFVKVRQITCDNRPISAARIAEARKAVASVGIPAYNQALAFQRLRWLATAAGAPVSERQAVLDACRHHADADLDAVDQSFARINFLVWLLPTAGFLGTVFGMTEALQAFAGVVESGSDFSFNAGLTDTARNLGVAFHTTLVGLAAVIPLLALATMVRSRTQSLIDSVNRYYLQLGTHMLYHVDGPPDPANAAAAESPAAPSWPTAPNAAGEVPTVIAMMASGDSLQNRQAAYLVQAVGQLAKSGIIEPDQFQAVVRADNETVTVPAIVNNDQGTQVLVFTWALPWDDAAIANFEAWLTSVGKIGEADQQAPVLLLSAEAWPIDQPAPKVLQALHLPMASDEAGPPADAVKTDLSDEQLEDTAQAPAPEPLSPPDAAATDAAAPIVDDDEDPLEQTQRTTAPAPLSPPVDG